MLYAHYSHVPERLMRPYKNFSFETDPKLYSRDDGSFYLHEPSLEALQSLRETLGKPIKINSGHRSPLHNALVKGAPRSMHLKIAFDIRTEGHDLFALLLLARKAGFTGVGYYNTFLHVDMGQKREWYGDTKAKKRWAKLPQYVSTALA